MAGDVLDLTAAEVVFGGQSSDVGVRQSGKHCAPDAHPGLGILQSVHVVVEQRTHAIPHALEIAKEFQIVEADVIVVVVDEEM